MKNRLPLAVLALLAINPVCADTSVTVDVLAVTKTDGRMYLSVFDNKKAWLKKPIVSESISVSENTNAEKLSIEIILPAGDYAFHVFQDLDSNGKMKTNFIGIPKEPTGVSRDAKGKFGPPKYKDAVVTVGDEALTVPINLTEI
ncbi:MAG: DUF2141 domain-containing protein [Woeseiaceae bacterium]